MVPQPREIKDPRAPETRRGRALRTVTGERWARRRTNVLGPPKGVTQNSGGGVRQEPQPLRQALCPRVLRRPFSPRRSYPQALDRRLLVGRMAYIVGRMAHDPLFAARRSPPLVAQHAHTGILRTPRSRFVARGFWAGSGPAVTIGAG